MDEMYDDDEDADLGKRLTPDEVLAKRAEIMFEFAELAARDVNRKTSMLKRQAISQARAVNAHLYTVTRPTKRGSTPGPRRRQRGMQP